jgi:hypothetical protein
MSGPGVPPPIVKTKALNCSHCGGPLTIRTGEHALNVVCLQCLSVLDAKDPNLAVLQQFQARERIVPRIPLGTRGRLHDIEYETVGFQQRTIVVEGVSYCWYEYLLFNPYHGYRYLSEYNGHWNDIVSTPALPSRVVSGRKPAAIVGGQTFLHFQTADAQTTYVMGEFPWQVRVGETVRASDYIAPPRILSSEETPNEVVWSIGDYTPGADIWRAFRLPGQPPPAEGVYANQPSPGPGRVRSAWMTFLLLACALFALMLFFAFSARNEQVFSGSYFFSPQTVGEPSFVTPVFDLPGHTSNVEVTVETDLRDTWVYLSFALINEATGQAYDFARELSYYSGTDSDGAWSEGGRSDTAVIPAVPPGRYYLRIEPEADKNGASVNYTLRLRRDVPSMTFFAIGLLLLLIPPIGVWMRARGFESRRWAESDYAPSGGSSSSGDDD